MNPNNNIENKDKANKGLIVLTMVLGLVLIVIWTVIFTYYKAGSFNPVDLFIEEEETTEPEKEKDVLPNPGEPMPPEEAAPAEEVAPAAEEPAPAEEKVDTFEDFISGSGRVRLASDFVSGEGYFEDILKKGNDYTLREMLDSIRQSDDSDIFGIDKDPELTYAKLSIHGNTLYALNMLYTSDIETMERCYIMRDGMGCPEIVFAVDGWSRSGYILYKNGIVSSDGSGGAGLHGGSEYAPDRSCSYKKVYDWEEHYYGYDFYDNVNYQPVEALNNTMKEAGQNEIASDVLYYSEEINGRMYYYYLGTEEHSISQKTVDYIDSVAEKYGFTFDGKASADDARKSYISQLGLDDVYEAKTEPNWEPVK